MRRKGELGQGAGQRIQIKDEYARVREVAGVHGNLGRKFIKYCITVVKKIMT